MTRYQAEATLLRMLLEAFRARGEQIRELSVLVTEHHVPRTGCAVPAVTLLADEEVA